MDFIMPTSAHQTALYKYAPYYRGPSIQNHGRCKGFSRVTETIPNSYLIWWIWKLTHAQMRVHYKFASPNLAARAFEIRGTKTNASRKWGRYSHTWRGQVWEKQGHPAEEEVGTQGKHPWPLRYPCQPDSWTVGEELKISNFYNNGNWFSLQV